MEKRPLRIIFNKSGGSGMTTRLTLPKKWIDEMGITPEKREVNAIFEDGKIIIQKTKKEQGD